MSRMQQKMKTGKQCLFKLTSPVTKPKVALSIGSRPNKGVPDRQTGPPQR